MTIFPDQVLPVSVSRHFSKLCYNTCT